MTRLNFRAQRLPRSTGGKKHPSLVSYGFFFTNLSAEKQSDARFPALTSAFRNFNVQYIPVCKTQPPPLLSISIFSAFFPLPRPFFNGENLQLLFLPHRRRIKRTAWRGACFIAWDQLCICRARWEPSWQSDLHMCCVPDCLCDVKGKRCGLFFIAVVYAYEPVVARNWL